MNLKKFSKNGLISLQLCKDKIICQGLESLKDNVFFSKKSVINILNLET